MLILKSYFRYVVNKYLMRKICFNNREVCIEEVFYLRSFEFGYFRCYPFIKCRYNLITYLTMQIYNHTNTHISKHLMFVRTLQSLAYLHYSIHLSIWIYLYIYSNLSLYLSNIYAFNPFLHWVIDSSIYMFYIY